MSTKNEDQVIDCIGDTPFLVAAAGGNWNEVKDMLRKGDVDVRHCNTFGQNALYFALAAGELDLAIGLYDAGARLDGLHLPENWESPNSSGAILATVAELRRTGRDVFFDPQNTVVDCCIWGNYPDAETRISNATREQLTEAISELIRNGRYMEKENLALLKKLVAHGGEIDLDLLAQYATVQPAQLRNSEFYTQTVRQYENAKEMNVLTAEEPLAQSTMTLDNYRAELEIQSDGEIRLFVAYDDPPFTDADFAGFPECITAQNVGNGLYFYIADSRTLSTLLKHVQLFL